MFRGAPPSSGAGPREWAALGVLVLAVLLLAIDGTVLALAVPSLSATLDPTANQLLWIGDVYSFALAGLLVTMGSVADRIGRKKLLMLGATGFGLASAIAAFAPSPEILIAARALLGVSGATIMPSTLSIIRHMFAVPAHRSRAIALWSVGAAGGAALGPLVGGVLLEHFWWGSAFLISIPVMLVLLAAGAFLLPESRNPHAQPIDLLSSLLSIAAIVPVVLAVKRIFGEGADVVTIASALLGVVCGWLFVRRQKRTADPMLDLELFRLPAFRGAVIGNGLAIFALSGLLFFFSQYLQLVRGLSPLQAGLVELPATLAMMVVVVLIGMAVARLGTGGSIGLGLVLGAVGLVTLAYAEGLAGHGGIIAALLAVGFGVGLASTVSTDAVVGSVPRGRAGAASAIPETAYELGGTRHRDPRLPRDGPVPPAAARPVGTAGGRSRPGHRIARRGTPGARGRGPGTDRRAAARLHGRHAGHCAGRCRHPARRGDPRLALHPVPARRRRRRGVDPGARRLRPRGPGRGALVSSTGGSRNAERTRHGILHAARAVLAERGTATTVQEVATAAGMSKSGLLHHFVSRDVLLRAVVEDCLQQVHGRVMAHLDLAENRPGKVLRAYVRALCGPAPGTRELRGPRPAPVRGARGRGAVRRRQREVAGAVRGRRTAPGSDPGRPVRRRGPRDGHRVRRARPHRGPGPGAAAAAVAHRRRRPAPPSRPRLT